MTSSESSSDSADSLFSFGVGTGLVGMFFVEKRQIHSLLQQKNSKY